MLGKVDSTASLKMSTSPSEDEDERAESKNGEDEHEGNSMVSDADRKEEAEIERTGSDKGGELNASGSEEEDDAEEVGNRSGSKPPGAESGGQEGPLNQSRSKTPPGGPQKGDAGRSRSLSPETYPQKSAIPEYARTPSREKRMRSTWRVKTPVLQVVDSGAAMPTTLSGTKTTDAPTSMAEMSSYWKQKKLLTVPIRAWKSLEPVMFAEDMEPPPHLQHWNEFSKRSTRESFLKRYNHHYKAIQPEKWSTNDLFSFVADSLVRDDQVDAAGLPLSPRHLKKVGHFRVENRLDVMVLQALLSLRLDGRKFVHASSAALSKILPISDYEVDDLKSAITHYVELNAHHKTANPEDDIATAGEAMQAASLEVQETEQVEQLLLTEIKVRTERAKLRELRSTLDPLKKRVEEGQEDYALIKGYLSRPRTPEQKALSRPASAALFQMRSNLRSDLEETQEKWDSLKQQEYEMERSVRELEVASLQVRDAVNKSRCERRERRTQLKAEMDARAAEDKKKKLQMMAVGDEMLLDAERFVSKAGVETQDRTRALLLSSASEKAKAARRIYEESFAIGERRRRLEAVEQLVVLEEEKRAGCERFLEQAKRHLFNANGSEIGDVDMAWRNLKRARDALESAKTETKRTGAVVQMQGPLREVEERLIEAEKRWSEGGGRLGTSGQVSHRSNLTPGSPGIVTPGRTGSRESVAQRIPSAAGSRRSEESRPGSRGSSRGGSGMTGPSTARSGSSASELGNPMFEEQLTKLIHEKQKEVLDQVQDSLCGMQAWLYELKTKRRQKQEEQEAAEALQLNSNAESAGSTRPTSPG